MHYFSTVCFVFRYYLFNIIILSYLPRMELFDRKD